MTLTDKTTRFRRRTTMEPGFSLPLRAGEVIGGKYEITGVLGEGAMGAVYRAQHVHFHREVAVKVLHPLLSRDRVMVRRFEREAQAAGRIGSEHIVKLLDAGAFAASERYIVMEYLEGESLASRLDRLGTLPERDVQSIGLQILDGLAYAHDARFVHRDLKPSNIFLVADYDGREDFVKILDFGVSKLNAVDAGDVTQTGVLLGTPHFMAPELIRGAVYADHRSDLYAVGVILFRALTGLTPFVGASAYELLHKIAHEEVPRVRTFAPDVDPGFAAIVDRALVRDPDHRFTDARAFAAALRAWADGTLTLAPLPSERSPKTRSDTDGRRSRRWPWLALPLVALALGAVVLLRPQIPAQHATSTLARVDVPEVPSAKPAAEKPAADAPQEKKKPKRRAAAPPKATAHETDEGYAPDVGRVSF